ncbi:hypothetical protein [Lysobacter firmicutimachus]|uniref:Uncharacterized protein n=1 Tax=Lysobacter firmicutimachus TaxID=1792846 RepID=A0ABU8D001_9GAMM
MTTATADGGVAIGNNSESSAVGAVAIGGSNSGTTAGARSAGTNAIALGVQSSVVAGATSGIAIGRGATVNGEHGVAQGDGAVSGAIGRNVAIGSASNANGGTAAGGAVAIGRQQTASGNGAVAIGDPNTATGTGAVAVGADNTANGQGAVALGNANSASGQGAVALGNVSSAGAAGAVALGDGASANIARSVALGSGSATAAAVGTANTVIRGTTYNFAGTAPASTVSVGTAGSERTVTNVAAGRLSATSTDAVNGSQLFATNQAVQAAGAGFAVTAQGANSSNVDPSESVDLRNGDGNIVVSKTAADNNVNFDLADDITVTSVTAGNSRLDNNGLTITGGPSVTATGINAGSRVITNVAAGVAGTDAVNKSQLDAVGATASAGFSVTAQGANGTNVAPGETVDLKNTDGNIAVSKTGADDSVNFDLADDITVTSVTAGNSRLDNNGLVITGGPSVTATGINAGNRVITNVAAGVAGTDAVNKSQLDAVAGGATTQGLNFTGNDNAAGDVHRDLGQTLSIRGDAATTGSYSGANLKTVTDPATGAIQLQLAESPKFGSVIVNDGGSGKISGVTAADLSAASTEAVNGSQLFQTNQDVAALGTRVTANEADIAALNAVVGPTDQAYQNANGHGVRYVRTNDTGLPESDAFATGANSTAIGYNAQASAEETLAVGENSVASQLSAMAVGSGAQATGEYAIAFGDNARASGQHSLSVGDESQATAAHAMAVGTAATASGALATTVGTFSEASGFRSTALGNEAAATASSATAIGMNSRASHAGSVALGADSVADGATLGNAAYVPPASTYAVAGTTPAGEVSVGGASSKRRLTNVAAGADDTDAANISQLKAVDSKITALGQDSLLWDPAANGGAGAYNANHGGTGPNKIVNVAPADLSATSADAVNGSQLFQTNQNVAALDGRMTTAEGNITNLDNRVTNVEGQMSSLGQDALKWDPAANGGAGAYNANHGGSGPNKIVNVAPADLSAASTDAVNGSQLFQTNQNVAALDGRMTAAEGDIANLDNRVTTNEGAITNLDNRVTTNEGDITNLKNQIGPTDPAYLQQNGRGTRYARTNDTGLPEDDAHAQAAGSTALGYNAVSSAADAVAIGRNAQTSHAGSVALGAGSVANGSTLGNAAYLVGGAATGEVNVGNRRVTGVAAGAEDSDAVNVAQLKAVSTSAAQAEQRAVKYDWTDSNGNGQIDPGEVDFSKATLAGPASSDGGVTGGTRLSNVAQGAVSATSTDAVNGAQLYAVAGQNDATYISRNGRGLRYARSNDTGLAEADAHAQAVGSSAVGYNATASAGNAVAVGRDSVAGHANSVALGAGSATTVGAQSGYNGAYVGASNSTGQVHVGGRTVGGVAAGTAADDAVNVAQLQAGVSDAVSQANSYTDARVNQVAGTVAQYDNRIGAVEGDVADVKNGSAGLFRVSQDNTAAPTASGANASAGGAGAVASGNASTALGSGAAASANNAVALGAGSVANQDNTVSVGSVGGERRVTNVAAGVADTDAVNVSQLKGFTTGGIQYDKNADGSNNTNSLTFNPNGSGQTTLRNVAAGTAPTDAANVGQVQAGVRDAVVQANSYTDNQVATVRNDVWKLNGDVRRLERDMHAGIATAIAIKPAPYVAGRTTYYAGFGAYKSEAAFGVSLRHTADSGRWSVEGGASSNSDGIGAYIGISGVLGD